jgi:hypothetical protein
MCKVQLGYSLGCPTIWRVTCDHCEPAQKKHHTHSQEPTELPAKRLRYLTMKDTECQELARATGLEMRTASTTTPSWTKSWGNLVIWN